MSASRNTIQVWTNNPTRKEALASGAITPGMQVERTSAAVDTVIAGDTADIAPKPLLIAEENELEGQEITDAYANGDRVFMRVFYPGDEVMALLLDGENVAKGDYLTPDGTGKWVKVTASEAKVLQASEAKDLTSTSADEHVLAEVC